MLIELRLVDLAHHTLHRMLLDRTVVQHAARLHRPIWFTAAEWQCLHEDRSEREMLVHDLIAEGTRQFYRSIIGNKWDRDRCTSLATYHLNTCLLASGNVVRRWRREREQPAAESLDDERNRARFDREFASLGGFDRVEDADELERCIASMPPELARAVRLKQVVPEMSWAEIARTLNLGRTLDTQLRAIRKYPRHEKEDL
jgi:DNA-directed RNA polymerase specialized sigma24 family protein